ncbi:MAG: ATP-binding protein [Gemmatimonadota bacterium]
MPPPAGQSSDPHEFLPRRSPSAAEQLEALGDLVVSLVENRSIGKVFAFLGRKLKALLGPVSVQVWLLDDAKTELHQVLAQVDDEQELAQRLAEHKVQPLATSTFTSAEAVRRREIVVRHAGPDVPAPVAEIMKAGDICLSVSVPILGRDEIHGAFNMMFRDDCELAPEELRFLNVLGRTVAAAVENARLLDSLTRERRWLRTVLDEVPSGILVAEGEDGRISSTNKEFERLLGPVQGLSLAEYVQRYDMRDPVTGELLEWRELAISRALIDGEASSTEYDVQGRDGVRRRLLVEGAPLHDPLRHEPAAIVAMQDVSGLRALERDNLRQSQLLQSTFDNVPAGIAILDAREARYVQVNDQFAAFFQHPRITRESLLGRRVSGLYREFDSGGAGAIFRRVAETGEAFSADGFAFDGFPRGRTYWNVSLVPLRENGRVDNLLFFALEVTGLVEAERRLRDALAEAERTGEWLESANRDLVQAVRVKDEFLSTLSHELRTPLTPILGWTRILKAHGSEPSLLDQGLRAIERNVMAQVRLVDDLLDLSRLAYDRVQLNLEPLDVNELLLQSWDDVSHAAEAKEVVRVMALRPRPVTVHGDRLRLRQVLAQLVENAIKFSEQGGEVRLATRLEGDTAEIEIADQGIGIDSEFLPRVFERFQQGDATTTRRHGGLGIGLSIARALTQMHGGTITAHSAGAGHGSRFIVRLTLADPAISAGAEAPSGPAASLAGLRVVLAEDDEDSREALRRLLELEGVQVVPAGSGLEAIDHALEFLPDVLLCDLQMGDIDGYEVASRLRTTLETARIRLVAITGHGSVMDVERTRAAGFDEHLLKPVGLEELTAAIRKALASRES